MYRLKFDRVKPEYVSSRYAEQGQAVYFDGDAQVYTVQNTPGTYFKSVGRLLQSFSKFAAKFGEMPEQDCDGYTIVDEPA